MARVEITHKCITIAREAARRDSLSRITGRSVFIKRYYGKYKLIGVEVSKKQRSCREMFADAQRLASKDLQIWNRKRHWAREAKRHKVKCAHRMAVSAFYKLLKDNKVDINEALFIMRRKGLKLHTNSNRIIPNISSAKLNPTANPNEIKSKLDLWINMNYDTLKPALKPNEVKPDHTTWRDINVNYYKANPLCLTTAAG